MSASTLVQKIIRRASGRADATPGAVVVMRVDLAMATDLSGSLWRPKLEELRAPIWDPTKIVLVNDHFAPGYDPYSASFLQGLRRFAADYGIANFHDMEGICHVILAEKGYLRPGIFVAGGDSHTPMAGAFGCLAMGFGATDMVAIAATGETWLQVPATMLIQLDGKLDTGVTAKDLMLMLCGRLGMNNAATVVQYRGAAVEAMPMSERLVLTNMAAELGCDSGIIEPDETTLTYLREHAGVIDEDALSWVSDDNAEYASIEVFDAKSVEPQVAAPHSPEKSAAASEFAGVRIDQAYIGACVGAKIEDLRMAAAALNGKKIAPGTRLLVAPASRATTTEAAGDGTLQTLLEAGATLLPTGCGACAGLGAGVLAQGDVCISTTNRNFKGRMGHKDSLVYLASPYTVAASAVHGHIADPRDFLCSELDA
jgi:3-isopropylmalate/(R)-2-methylmalate dehydratase large subunit